MSEQADFSAADSLLSELVEFRRDLHRHPELGWKEERTTGKICSFLEKIGVEYRTVPGMTGVIAEIPGAANVPIVALRADIDALPIEEETGLEYTSEAKGVMHACGHDGHTSMLLGAAMLLKEGKPLPAPVRLIFQPAEEVGDGAPRLMEKGVLDGVGMIFGGHIDKSFDVGVIAVTDGVVNASTDTFYIRVTGRGGHAARPHETVDAVVVGSHLVVAMQTLISRRVNPAYPAVVTVGKMAAGTTSNVIASTCLMEGTIRTQNETVRKELKEALVRTCNAIGQMHDATIECNIVEGLPVLDNSPESTLIARESVLSAFGESALDEMKTANMGGEDFAFYTTVVPGCYVRFGGYSEGCDFAAHSSRFIFDEGCLLVGARYYADVARRAGERLSSSSES